MAVDGIGVAVIGAGTVLVYAGIKGYSLPDVVRNVVSGQPVATGVSLHKLTVVEPVPDAASAQGGTGGSSRAVAKSIGKMLAAGHGWAGDEWTALETLWQGESGWDRTARNPTSGAYGIPQALPPTKMPLAARPEDMGGSSDARAQIQWGLSYIKERYGSPSKALAFWRSKSPHWY